MNERMVIKTAKSLNKEKYMLDKLNKQIESLQEKENSLKKEFKEITQNLQNSKLKEQEMKEENTKIKQMAEEEAACLALKLLKGKRTNFSPFGDV